MAIEFTKTETKWTLSYRSMVKVPKRTFETRHTALGASGIVLCTSEQDAIEKATELHKKNPEMTIRLTKTVTTETDVKLPDGIGLSHEEYLNHVRAMHPDKFKRRA